MMLFLIFIVYPNTTEDPYSRIINIIYQSTSRILWSIAVSYLILVCFTSSGGLINKFLSFNYNDYKKEIGLYLVKKYNKLK